MKRLIDQDPQREQRRQSLLLSRLEVGFRNRIRSEINRASSEMVQFFAETGEVPIPRGHVERLSAIYRAMAVSVTSVFGGRVLDQAKSAGLIVERKDFADTMARIALAYISGEASRRRITSVAETTRSQIIRAVAAGFADGLGQRGVADYVMDVIPSINAARAGLIARTETHGAANNGANEAARETGLQLRREWISSEDERTRDSHDMGLIEIVGMDEPFDVGGELLQYPGDPNGPPGETINCRCAIGFIVDE